MSVALSAGQMHPAIDVLSNFQLRLLNKEQTAGTYRDGLMHKLFLEPKGLKGWRDSW
ncbi:Hypothetical protein FKW44_005721, partial [Caligus rogercresseyi]